METKINPLRAGFKNYTKSQSQKLNPAFLYVLQTPSIDELVDGVLWVLFPDPDEGISELLDSTCQHEKN